MFLNGNGMRYIFIAVFLCLFCWGHAFCASANKCVVATDLRCEYLTNLPVIDEVTPRLTWTVKSAERNQSQAAYRILVAGSKENLTAGKADLWDSGKVESGRSLNITYKGKPLTSGMRCFWKVRLWDKHGNAGPWSRPAHWEMGLMNSGDWTGEWINDGEPTPDKDEDFYKDDPAPLFRREFETGKSVKRARLYISGLGYYEARLDGKRIGDHVLDPGWTDYAERVYYSTYDLTSRLKEGKHTIGVILGNGWYNPLPLRMWGHLNLREHLPVGRPRFIAQLNIQYTDGTRQSIVTDKSWKVSDGPILRNNVYLGEVYDARKEKPGWDMPAYDDSQWRNASLATEPLGPLEAQPLPPIRITSKLRPVNVSEPKDGVYVFDMGQNFAGWARLRVKGPAGTKVKMRFGELLHKDGTVNTLTAVCGQIKRDGRGGPGAPDVAEQCNTYILNGRGEEVYTPSFTFHGFRYAEVTGYPGKPPKDAIVGLRLNTDVETAGSFACSNELFNRIQKNCLWTFLGNIFSVQSDCPHREKFGYGADAISVSEAYMYNFDMSAFYAKMVRDFQDAARPNGGLTETAPYVGISAGKFGGGAGPIGWGSAHPVLQNQLYQYYGNKQLITEQYNTTLEWGKLIRSRSRDKDYIIDHGISDHESIDPKPVAVSGTAFHYQNAELLSRFADLLGKEKDAKDHAKWARKVKESFIRHFITSDGKVGPHTQAAQAFALYYNLVPPENREAVVNVLLREIQRHNGHLSTGFFGTKYLLDVLTRTGHANVAYKIASQKTVPGWGYEITKYDATTLWEHWKYSTNTYSHNHPAFGSVSEWFYKALAGINPHPDAVGFDRIVIKPQVLDELSWVRASYDSIRGRIRSEWKREQGRLELKVEIPANTTAVVYIPTKDPDKITEGQVTASDAYGVKFLRRENDTAVYRIGSGIYNFVSSK